MIRQLGEEMEREKRRKPGAQAGLRARNLTPDPTGYDEIDPADLLDPEEFGISRRDFKSIRP